MGTAAPLPSTDLPLLKDLLHKGAFMKNGRINHQESAEHLQVSPQEIRRCWERVANAMGYGQDFLNFWSRRLGEALLGLAADLLRDQAQIQVYRQQQRQRPDPKARLGRVQRIRKQLGCRPLPAQLKNMLARYCGRGVRRQLQALTILGDAQILLPKEPATHLWTYEACLVARDLRGAMQSLRRARHCGAEPVACLLARARLLEARQRDAQALTLLQRQLTRHPRDPRLLQAIASLTEPSPAPAPRHAPSPDHRAPESYAACHQSPCAGTALPPQPAIPAAHSETLSPA